MTMIDDAPRVTSIPFAELGLPPRILQRLQSQGMSDSFPIQAAVIPDALAGRDVAGRAWRRARGTRIGDLHAPVRDRHAARGAHHFDGEERSHDVGDRARRNDLQALAGAALERREQAPLLEVDDRPLVAGRALGRVLGPGARRPGQRDRDGIAQ